MYEIYSIIVVRIADVSPDAGDGAGIENGDFRLGKDFGELWIYSDVIKVEIQVVTKLCLRFSGSEIVGKHL